jgi:hypothetical protein
MSVTGAMMPGMSIPVALDELRDEIVVRGDAAFVVTSGDTAPHVVSARIGWRGDDLEAGAGNRTAANVALRPAITVLWPSSSFDDYSLIVDGSASVVDGRLLVTPERAVLHRSAEAAGDDPSCVTLL